MFCCFHCHWTGCMLSDSPEMCALCACQPYMFIVKDMDIVYDLSCALSLVWVYCCVTPWPSTSLICEASLLCCHILVRPVSLIPSFVRGKRCFQGLLIFIVQTDWPECDMALEQIYILFAQLPVIRSLFKADFFIRYNWRMRLGTVSFHCCLDWVFLLVSCSLKCGVFTLWVFSVCAGSVTLPSTGCFPVKVLLLSGKWFWQ